MDAVRIIPRCERPFDVSKLIYLHCVDLGSKKFTPVTSFTCLEISCLLGHFSFPSELAVRRLCCVLWSDDCRRFTYPLHLSASCHMCRRKLVQSFSPVLLSVKSSCYFTVTILLYSYSIIVEVIVTLFCLFTICLT